MQGSCDVQRAFGQHYRDAEGGMQCALDIAASGKNATSDRDKSTFGPFTDETCSDGAVDRWHSPQWGAVFVFFAQGRRLGCVQPYTTFALKPTRSAVRCLACWHIRLMLAAAAAERAVASYSAQERSGRSRRIFAGQPQQIHTPAPRSAI